MFWCRPPLLTFETERLTLRSPRRGDYRSWAAAREASRPHLEPWEPAWPQDAHSRADWRRRLRLWRRSQHGGRSAVFFMWRRADHALIGGVSLTNIRHSPINAASLGYWIGAAFEGQGYMSEAVRGVCDWSVVHLGLRRIEAGTLPENERSRRVLTRCGFQEEGYARNYLQIAGKLRDHVLFAYSHDLAGDTEWPDNEKPTP